MYLDHIFLSFVFSSLDRMQKVMRTKQNIELGEALLKEASLYSNKLCLGRVLGDTWQCLILSVLCSLSPFHVLDQQGEGSAGREICTRPPQLRTFRSRKSLAQNDALLGSFRKQGRMFLTYMCNFKPIEADGSRWRWQRYGCRSYKWRRREYGVRDWG